MKDAADALMLFILFFALSMLMFTLGEWSGETRTKRDAVIKGHAEWAAAKNGDSVFKWKEMK